MPNLTKKELRKAAIEAAECSGFMQNFKYKIWTEHKEIEIGESTLDTLAMLAYDLLK